MHAARADLLLLPRCALVFADDERTPRRRIEGRRTEELNTFSLHLALSAALGPLWPPTALWLLCGPCSARGCSPRTLLTQDPCRHHLRSAARGVLMTCLWLLLTTTFLNINVSQSLLYLTFDVKAILPNSGDKVALDSDVLGVCSCEAIGAPMFSHTRNASANLDADVWTDLDDDVLDSDGLPLLYKQWTDMNDVPGPPVAPPVAPATPVAPVALPVSTPPSGTFKILLISVVRLAPKGPATVAASTLPKLKYVPLACSLLARTALRASFDQTGTLI